MEFLNNKKKENALGQLIRIAILSWSAALLTASYAGMLSKMDPTFIATVFTASAATFGINTMKKGDDDDDKKEEPQRTEYVVTPQPPKEEPVWVEPVQERTEELPLVMTTNDSLWAKDESTDEDIDNEKPFQRGDL